MRLTSPVQQQVAKNDTFRWVAWLHRGCMRGSHGDYGSSDGFEKKYKSASLFQACGVYLGVSKVYCIGREQL